MAYFGKVRYWLAAHVTEGVYMGASFQQDSEGSRFSRHYREDLEGASNWRLPTTLIRHMRVVMHPAPVRHPPFRHVSYSRGQFIRLLLHQE